VPPPSKTGRGERGGGRGRIIPWSKNGTAAAVAAPAAAAVFADFDDANDDICKSKLMQTKAKPSAAVARKQINLYFSLGTCGAGRNPNFKAIVRNLLLKIGLPPNDYGSSNVAHL